MKQAPTTRGKKKKRKAFDYLRYRVEVYETDKLPPKKKITNMNSTEPKIFKDTINEKQIRQDKNGRDYLLLKLDNQEAIFVFPNQDTPSDRWIELQEGQEYTFTVKEGLNASNILIDFELDLWK